MTLDEFASVLFWVMAPPLLLGTALLRLVWFRAGISCRTCFWFAVAILFVLTIVFVVAIIVFDIQWSWLKMRDVDIFGFRTMWAPIAFVAVVLAFPFATWRLVSLKKTANRLLPKGR